MDNDLELAKWKANNLLDKIEKPKNEIESDDILVVIEALEDVIEARNVEDIPREIGGVLFFKSVEIEKQLGIDGFASEFRKIHESLGRDAELERELIQNEEQLDLSKLRKIDDKYE